MNNIWEIIAKMNLKDKWVLTWTCIGFISKRASAMSIFAIALFVILDILRQNDLEKVSQTT
jgi:hypothetical protein